MLGRYDYMGMTARYVTRPEYEQCVGTMETATRCPYGTQGLLCDISIRYDIISHGVMEQHTHEVLMKTGNNIHFPCLEDRLNVDGVVSRA